MSNFCIKCGAPLKDDAKFCSACGTKVLGENSNQPPMPYESQECYEGFNSPPNQNKIAGLYVKFYDTFLKKDGRLNRWRYFKRALIVNFFFSIILAPFNSYSDKELENLLPELSLFILVVCGLQIYFLYCLNVRRLHDLNYNATIAFVIAVATVLTAFDIFAIQLMILCFAVNMFLLFKRGTVGSNKYGEDPLADKNH